MSQHYSNSERAKDDDEQDGDLVNTRYVVIPSYVWRHTSGRSASVMGACPWRGEADRDQWTREQTGWTVRNVQDSTQGIGRMPWARVEDAEAWALLRNHTSTGCACQCHDMDEVTMTPDQHGNGAPIVGMIAGMSCCYSPDEQGRITGLAFIGTY